MKCLKKPLQRSGLLQVKRSKTGNIGFDSPQSRARRAGKMFSLSAPIPLQRWKSQCPDTRVTVRQMNFALSRFTCYLSAPGSKAAIKKLIEQFENKAPSPFKKKHSRTNKYLVPVRKFLSYQLSAPKQKVKNTDHKKLGFSYYILVSFWCVRQSLWVCIPRQSLGTRDSPAGCIPCTIDKIRGGDWLK